MLYFEIHEIKLYNNYKSGRIFIINPKKWTMNFEFRNKEWKKEKRNQ